MEMAMLWLTLCSVAAAAAAAVVAVVQAQSAMKSREDAEAARDVALDAERRQRVTQGVDAALDAMTHLSTAAFTTDVQQSAHLRVQAARCLSDCQGVLIGENVPLGNWLAQELGIVASQGLEDVDGRGLPRLLQQIIWRGAAFVQTVQDWREDEKDLAWFAQAEHLPLAATPEYETDPLPQ